jgi:23S rRNA (guanine2445-N2)-methyltransferase / 23S rRNA (guanine2069-N7)-methyltransferase
VGIFLDARLLRARIRRVSRGKRVLNLFCYTATASVCAAAGGALATVSVDTSNTYLEWARRNFSLNSLAAEVRQGAGVSGGARGNVLIRSDCLSWLQGSRDRFDIIYAGPPTHSRGSGRADFDVQRDHPELLRLCLRRLSPGGLILFATNARKFRLHERELEAGHVEDVTESLTPFDFARSRERRRVYEVREAGSAVGGAVGGDPIPTPCPRRASPP